MCYDVVLMNPLDVIHLGDSLLGFLVGSIANETEATAASSVAILDNDLREGRSALSSC
jgi:hypothetical protein